MLASSSIPFSERFVVQHIAYLRRSWLQLLDAGDQLLVDRIILIAACFPVFFYFAEPSFFYEKSDLFLLYFVRITGYNTGNWVV